MIKSVINKIKYLFATLTNDGFISYLRNKGVLIGNGCVFRNRNTIRIDITRPSLVTIGDNVDFNMNFQLLTHDYATSVFIRKYGEFINSSGRVKIGNNIVFGTNCIVLKGVEIGDNCIIGAGSVVSKNIPSNSVAVGRPAKVICSVDEFYERRKKECVNEAFEYANSIIDRYGREPRYEDFFEEFHLFVDKTNVNQYPNLSIINQLGGRYCAWIENHTALFSSFEEFIEKAKQHQNK